MKLMKLVAIVFCLLVTSDLANAQLPPNYQAARDSASSLSNLFGGGNSNAGALGNLFGGGSGGGLGEAFGMNRGAGGQPAQGSMGGLQAMGGLQKLQGLLPALGGAGQNQNTGTDFLSRLNQSSKSLVDRTTGWARQKKQKMTQKMLGNTLGSLVPGLNQEQSSQTKSAFDWLKPKALQAPTQPPLRSAQNYGQQPGIRY